MMQRVVIESPCKGQVPRWVPAWLAPLFERISRFANHEYALQCVSDSLHRGEAPYASHVFFDRSGLLDDADPSQRYLGMAAGASWTTQAQLMAVYCDRGLSEGMQRAIKAASQAGIPIQLRYLKHPERDTALPQEPNA